MDRPTLEVADIFRRYGDVYRQQHHASLSTAQRRVMTAIETCRTAVLGGHLEQCDACGHERNAYNSCANRHGPKCQSWKRAAWIDARTVELLDVENGEVRFTDKDYRADPPPSPKTMTLAAGEFIRRFLLHVLPTGLHRIRDYGFLGARHRRAKLARGRQLLGAPTSAPPPSAATAAPDYRDRVEALTGISWRVCPACHHGEMIIIERLVPAARPGFVNPDTS